MVQIGIAGVGFMGMIHYLAAGRLEAGAARVRAVCSRDPKKRAGDWTGIRGNFGPPGEVMDLTGVRAYAALEELLADPEIDLIDVCLPTDQHFTAARQALRAGKHVLVEKPLTLAVDEAATLVEEADRAGRLLMVAHVLPFFPEFRFAHEYMRSEAGGRVLAAHFDRVISQPDWSSAIADPGKTGGPVVDLHIHDTHFFNLLWGLPAAVTSRGVVDRFGHVQHAATQYHYPADRGPGCVTCVSGAICMKGRPFIHGFEIFMERATLLFHAGIQPLTLLNDDGEVQPLQLPGSGDPVDAFADELLTAVMGVLNQAPPDLLRADLARDALILCRKEEESIRAGRTVAL